jgi:hypothetical protein
MSQWRALAHVIWGLHILEQKQRSERGFVLACGMQTDTYSTRAERLLVCIRGFAACARETLSKAAATAAAVASRHNHTHTSYKSNKNSSSSERLTQTYTTSIRRHNSTYRATLTTAHSRILVLYALLLSVAVLCCIASFLIAS